METVIKTVKVMHTMCLMHQSTWLAHNRPYSKKYSNYTSNRRVYVPIAQEIIISKNQNHMPKESGLHSKQKNSNWL